MGELFDLLGSHITVLDYRIPTRLFIAGGCLLLALGLRSWWPAIIGAFVLFGYYFLVILQML